MPLQKLPSGTSHTTSAQEVHSRTPSRQTVGFVGYDVVDKVGFMVPIDRHDAATLPPIIRQHIVPGTTDIWAT